MTRLELYLHGIRQLAPAISESGTWSGVETSERGEESCDLMGIFQSEPGGQAARVVKAGRHPGPGEVVLSLHAEYEATEVAQHLLRA